MYYVVREKQIIGTHPSRDKIMKQEVLYKGTNPKFANLTQRKANSGLSKFDERRVSIYSGIGDTDRIQLHKY